MEIKNIPDVKSIFFDNKNLKQTIFKNTFWLVAAEIITRFLKLVLIIFIARIFGATDYGKLSFALAFIGLFGVFSDFGISSITTREFSRDREKEKEFHNIFSLKIILSLITLSLILIGSFFITPDLVVRRVIWILGLYTIFANFTEIIFAFFRARQKMEYESWAKIFQALLINGFGFFIILNFPSIQNLSLSYLFASLVSLILILAFFHFKVFPISISWEKNTWLTFLGMSWPLASAGIFATIYLNIDSTILGFFGQITETGWYNAAHEIIGATLIPAELISTSFFPILCMAFKESKEKLQKIWNYFNETIAFLAIPIMVGGITLAQKIIYRMYGSSYSPAILAFQILILMTGISFFCSPLTRLLIVSDHQKKLFWIYLTAAATNIALNLVLIPHFSLYGAAISAVVTLFLIFILLLIFSLKFTSIRPLNFGSFLTFLNALLASIAMYFVISHPSIYKLNILLLILVGILAYSISFFLLCSLLKDSFRKNVWKK